ncbi:MAG: hypothetical protein E6Q50_13610 [Lysobacter sp.]|nr:MAG: hypothetical protein E6Q50_13610 [Lysobacter sp.]
MRLASCLLALSLAALSACAGPKADLSALGDPAPRLVGHWATSAGDQLYYGPLDTATKTGTYTLIQSRGHRFDHAYSVQSSDPSKQAIQATYLFADGDRASIAFELSADGKTLASTQEITGMRIATDATRVDDRTAP